ncbi:MAG: ferrous iron transport protein A [Candidatus Methanomethylophilaceae archaeon]
MKTLKDAAFGEPVKVVSIGGDGPVRRRIMDMGVTRGCMVTVNRCAPLGDPLEITVRGYELTIRKEDAKLIGIE